MAEQGFDGFSQTLWFGAVGPKGMPPEIVGKVHDAIKEWADSPAGKEKLASLGLTPVVNTPDEMKVAIESEIQSIKPLVDAGLVQPT